MNRQRKRRAGIPTIDENRSHLCQSLFLSLDRLQRPIAIRHLRRGHADRMGQALRIDHDMALDARNFLAGVVAFVPRAVGILHALRINDAKTRLDVAPLFDTGRANLIFLKPAPAGSILLHRARSTAQNRSVRCAISENRSVACAIGSRS